MANQYEAARDIYAAWGVDTEEALRRMDTIPVSINCCSWMTLRALRILTLR